MAGAERKKVKDEDAEKKKAEEAMKVIERVGKQLEAGYGILPNKDDLIRLLKQAANAFKDLQRSPSSHELTVKPLNDSLIAHGLLLHHDKDVKLLVGNCIFEIIRILAPNLALNDEVLQDVFRLLIDVFGDLGDIAGPFFPIRAKLLEKAAQVPYCVLMIDTGCDDLALKMFKTFFNVVREDHPQYVVDSMSLMMSNIMEEILKKAGSNYLGYERASQPFLDVILQNIIKHREGVSPGSFLLASSFVRDCGLKLQRCICLFLTACISNREASASPIKELYPNIMAEVFQLAPQMLSWVMPYLTDELTDNRAAVRIKAVNLVRKLLLLSEPKSNEAQEYCDILVELLFSDTSAEVRLSVLSSAESLYNVSRPKTKVLDAIRLQLLDRVPKVRAEAVEMVCELVKVNEYGDLSDLVTRASERLSDTRVSVRSKALKKLLELYQGYCKRCEMDSGLLNEDIEEIPCKLLMLLYLKGCPDYRPHNIECFLADLFPASLSMGEQIRHWTYLFSIFKPVHLNALNIILLKKRRLRDRLTELVDLCNSPVGNDDGESKGKMESLVVKMSECFPKPGKAKVCFQKLEQLYSSPSNVLHHLLKEATTVDFGTNEDREFGGENELHDFYRTLFRKCSYNIFSTKHVLCIIHFLADEESKLKPLKNHLFQLLLTIVGAFPSLLKGSEEQFLLLLSQKKIPFDEQLVKMLVRERCQLSIKLRDVHYSFLQNVCLEGSRKIAKLAVTVIAAFAESSDHLILMELHQVLLHSLSKRENVPTVLQSLGCLAQHFVSAFETHEKEVTQLIVEQIFQGRDDVLASKDGEFADVTSQWCRSCNLKVCGLKALVRSFLPHKDTHVNRSINFLLDIVLRLLLNSEFSACNKNCEKDQKCIPSAAAKSVLRLSRKWDSYITPQIYRLAILTVKDPSPGLCRSLVHKIHKLLVNRSLPCRYACAFSFAAADSVALKYLDKFIRMYGKVTQMEGNSAFVVVFLIHLLAHNSDFPVPGCQHEKVYARFLSPLFITMQALVKGSSSRASSILPTLQSIFNAIKRAEDAIDDRMTPKLHFLAEIGISILSSLVNAEILISQSPALVQLPPSFYKNGASQMRQATNYPMVGCKEYTSFAKKLVFCLQNEGSGVHN